MLDSTDRSGLRAAAATISRIKKERFLRAFSEDEFRDRVVRPLFSKLGFKDGRDLCGPTEEGKDAVFLSRTLIGTTDVVVVQTKKGNLNLASTAKDNLLNAVTQLRTAGSTTVPFVKTREKRLPAKIMLVASGKINQAARKHIVDELDDPRLEFLDSDELIPLIDENYPELWLGIDADVMPYMRALRRAIEESSENIAIAEFMQGATPAATDAMFVELHLLRTVLRPRKRKGQFETVPKFLEIPVVALLTKPERLVLVVGEAGAGKSTAIRRLAYVVAGKALTSQEGLQVPVLLRAVDLARNLSESLVDAAAAETQRLSLGHSAFSGDDLQNGRVVMLIDALDEVGNETERTDILDRIAAFNEQYPKCLVVLTSRDHSFLKNLPVLAVYTRYRVATISLRQAEQLVGKLEKKGALPAEQSKEVVRRLEQIHGMALNPLLVTVFAVTSDIGRRDIPANITELFKKFTELMLGRWDATKGFSYQYQAPLKDFVLTQLAFDMHSERSTDISLEAFSARIASELRNRGHQADSDQLIDEILNRSGLLRVVGDRVEFRHLLIQEFFAGRGIPAENLIEELVFDDWWRRSVVFYFGDRPANSSALSRIRAVLPGRTAVERFTAAGTLGLALQASYLVALNEKTAGFVDVIDTLADVMSDVVEAMSETGKFPLSGFLMYYINGRDSVALTALDGAAVDVVSGIRASVATKENKELRQFWVIVGLLEAGLVTEAEMLMRKFRPSDRRLLLGIYLGCALIQHVRMIGDTERRSARKICDRLIDDIAGLAKMVMDEFKTQLLEVRQGQLAALPPSTQAT